MQFLQNTVSTDVNVMIGSAGLVAAIVSIGIAVMALSGNDITPMKLVAIISIFLLAIVLSIYYYIETKNPEHLSPRKEWKKAQKLIDQIITGRISDPQKIKEKWLNRNEGNGKNK